MTKAEVDALMRGVAPVVRGYVAKSNAELAVRVDARLDAMEQALGQMARERQAPGVQPSSALNGRRLSENAIAGRQMARIGITP